MSIQEQRRARFEEDFRKRYGDEFDPASLRRRDDGSYDGVIAYQAWLVWNAALDSVVIELPGKLEDKPYACYEGGWNDALLEAGGRIETAGLKVAP